MYRLPVIAIFGIVLLIINLTKSPINYLADVIVVAVSEFEKAVFSVIASVVGIGLLTTPVNQTQSQHFDRDLGVVPVAKWADISDCFDNNPTKYDVSWELSSGWRNAYFISYYFPESCFYERDYVKVKFYPAVMVGTK